MEQFMFEFRGENFGVHSVFASMICHGTDMNWRRQTEAPRKLAMIDLSFAP